MIHEIVNFRPLGDRDRAVCRCGWTSDPAHSHTTLVQLFEVHRLDTRDEYLASKEK